MYTFPYANWNFKIVQITIIKTEKFIIALAGPLALGEMGKVACEDVLFCCHMDMGNFCFVSLWNFVWCHWYSIGYNPFTKAENHGKNNSPDSQNGGNYFYICQ